MVFAIIALFGSAALAIDGGMLYFQRRAAQSAVDNAAMTGALAIIKGYNASQIDTIVHERTTVNGFDNTSDDVEVQVFWPPQAPNPYAGNADFIQVIITSRIPLAFAQIVYQGPVEVTVEAVAHARLDVEIAPGAAIFAENPTACKALEFSGGPLAQIFGGGNVHSNSDADCQCGGSGQKGGTGEIDVLDGGEVTVSGCWKDAGTSGYVNPSPIEYVAQQELNEVPTPDCSGLPVNGSINASSSGTLQPGIYESIKILAGAEVTLAPGMYCLNGSLGGAAIDIGGGGSLYGDGVMIYFMDTAGSFRTNGGAQVYLNAPTDLKDASGNQWAGMLIYVHPDNAYDIILAGGTNSWFEGTIYAIGSVCYVTGNTGAVAFKTQVICDTVKVDGTGDLDLFYDAGRNYHIPNAVELSQ